MLSRETWTFVKLLLRSRNYGLIHWILTTSNEVGTTGCSRFAEEEIEEAAVKYVARRHGACRWSGQPWDPAAWPGNPCACSCSVPGTTRTLARTSAVHGGSGGGNGREEPRGRESLAGLEGSVGGGMELRERAPGRGHSLKTGGKKGQAWGVLEAVWAAEPRRSRTGLPLTPERSWLPSLAASIPGRPPLPDCGEARERWAGRRFGKGRQWHYHWPGWLSQSQKTGMGSPQGPLELPAAGLGRLQGPSRSWPQTAPQSPMSIGHGGREPGAGRVRQAWGQPHFHWGPVG